MPNEFSDPPDQEYNNMDYQDREKSKVYMMLSLNNLSINWHDNLIENSIAPSDGSSDSTALSNVYQQQDIAKMESYYNEDQSEKNIYNPKDDPNHPVVSAIVIKKTTNKLTLVCIWQNWPQRKKYLALLAISLDSFIGYFTSAIYVRFIQ